MINNWIKERRLYLLVCAAQNKISIESQFSSFCGQVLGRKGIQWFDLTAFFHVQINRDVLFFFCLGCLFRTQHRYKEEWSYDREESPNFRNLGSSINWILLFVFVRIRQGDCKLHLNFVFNKEFLVSFLFFASKLLPVGCFNVCMCVYMWYVCLCLCLVCVVCFLVWCVYVCMVFVCVHLYVFAFVWFLRVCLHVCISMCLYACVIVYAFVWYVCIFLYLYVYCVSMCVYFLCICIFPCVCVYLCFWCVCIFMCVYLCMCTCRVYLCVWCVCVCVCCVSVFICLFFPTQLMHGLLSFSVVEQDGFLSKNQWNCFPRWDVILYCLLFALVPNFIPKLNFHRAGGSAGLSGHVVGTNLKAESPVPKPTLWTVCPPSPRLCDKDQGRLYPLTLPDPLLSSIPQCSVLSLQITLACYSQASNAQKNQSDFVSKQWPLSLSGLQSCLPTKNK